MRNGFWHKPSPSMLVAIIALVFGASGTAVAASGLVSGDKLIEKHSLSGNRLKNYTVTRRQVNFSKLGTVPSANYSRTAGVASDADNAQTVDGFSPSSFEPAADSTRSGFVYIGQDTSVTLATFGPFTLTADCVNNGTNNGGWDAKITVSSSQGNSEVDGSPLSGTTTVVDTGSVSGQTEAKKTGVDFASTGNGEPDQSVAYFGDVMIIADYGGMYSDSCMASALISAS